MCYLWNLVAAETREGDVYQTLLKKLELEQKALGGKVFDVLGKAIAGAELRELMIQAIRYGDRPDVRERLNQVVVDRLDQQRLRELLEERALVRDSMDASKVQQIRCPGHPLLDTAINLIQERYRDLLKQGVVLVDANDPSEQVRALVYLEHSIQDATTDANGKRRVASRRMQYVEIDPEGNAQNAGYAPYLNYRPLLEETSLIAPLLESGCKRTWSFRQTATRSPT